MVELKITIPEFNFDLAQGQDLTPSVTYVTDGVPDTLAGASLKMEIRSADYRRIIDTLSTDNGRIVITGANAFEIRFPAAATSAYEIAGPVTPLLYSLERTAALVTKRLFEGSITVKREVTK
jgi:hypothetical protein